MRESKETQWWLAEIDIHGNPTLCDGAHSDRAGADRAFYLHMRLGLEGGKRYVVAKVELLEPVANADGVDETALRSLNAIGMRP